MLWERARVYACVLCMWLLAHTHARAVVGGEFAFLGTAFYVQWLCGGECETVLVWVRERVSEESVRVWA